MKDKWEQIAERWKQFASEAKKQWGSLTDDDVIQVNGDRKILSGLIQKYYSIPKKIAEKQIDTWVNKMKV